MAHLLRRCPLVSQDDRQTIYQAIQQQTPELNRQSHQIEQPHNPPPLVDYAADLHPTFLTARDQEGLHTLAEASSRLAGDDQVQQPPISVIGHGIAENNFMAQMQSAANPTAFPNGPAPDAAVMYVSDPMGQMSQPVDTAVNAALAPSPLMQAASAANEELEQFGTQTQFQGAADRQFGGVAADESFLQSSQANSDHGTISWGPTNASNTQAFGDMTGQSYTVYR